MLNRLLYPQCIYSEDNNYHSIDALIQGLKNISKYGTRPFPRDITKFSKKLDNGCSDLSTFYSIYCPSNNTRNIGSFIKNVLSLLDITTDYELLRFDSISDLLKSGITKYCQMIIVYIPKVDSISIRRAKSLYIDVGHYKIPLILKSVVNISNGKYNSILNVNDKYVNYTNGNIELYKYIKLTGNIFIFEHSLINNMFFSSSDNIENQIRVVPYTKMNNKDLRIANNSSSTLLIYPRSSSTQYHYRNNNNKSSPYRNNSTRYQITSSKVTRNKPSHSFDVRGNDFDILAEDNPMRMTESIRPTAKNLDHNKLLSPIFFEQHDFTRRNDMSGIDPNIARSVRSSAYPKSEIDRDNLLLREKNYNIHLSKHVISPIRYKRNSGLNESKETLSGTNHDLPQSSRELDNKDLINFPSFELFSSNIGGFPSSNFVENNETNNNDTNNINAHLSRIKENISDIKPSKVKNTSNTNTDHLLKYKSPISTSISRHKRFDNQQQNQDHRNLRSNHNNNNNINKHEITKTTTTTSYHTLSNQSHRNNINQRNIVKPQERVKAIPERTSKGQSLSNQNKDIKQERSQVKKPIDTNKAMERKIDSKTDRKKPIAHEKSDQKQIEQTSSHSSRKLKDEPNNKFLHKSHAMNSKKLSKHHKPTDINNNITHDQEYSEITRTETIVTEVIHNNKHSTKKQEKKTEEIVLNGSGHVDEELSLEEDEIFERNDNEGQNVENVDNNLDDDEGEKEYEEDDNQEGNEVEDNQEGNEEDDNQEGNEVEDNQEGNEEGDDQECNEEVFSEEEDATNVNQDEEDGEHIEVEPEPVEILEEIPEVNKKKKKFKGLVNKVIDQNKEENDSKVRQTDVIVQETTVVTRQYVVSTDEEDDINVEDKNEDDNENNDQIDEEEINVEEFGEDQPEQIEEDDKFGVEGEQTGFGDEEVIEEPEKTSKKTKHKSKTEEINDDDFGENNNDSGFGGFGNESFDNQENIVDNEPPKEKTKKSHREKHREVNDDSFGGDSFEAGQEVKSKKKKHKEVNDDSYGADAFEPEPEKKSKKNKHKEENDGFADDGFEPEISEKKSKKNKHKEENEGFADDGFNDVETTKKSKKEKHKKEENNEGFGGFGDDAFNDNGFGDGKPDDGFGDEAPKKHKKHKNSENDNDNDEFTEKKSKKHKHRHHDE